ncbi:hypothetical protein [Xanthobacter autotrophicus]|uniref:hypothetical protein n=1 Tax=Xanthobacter autotrophicus TaxID=280 RepID=UPI00372AB549
MAFPNDKPSALALELVEQEVHIILTFRSADEAEAVYDRIASALRAGTGITIGGDKPLMLEEVGGAA